jgi:hypothetical protein
VWQQITQIKTQTLKPQIHDSSSFLFIDNKFLQLFSNEKALKTVKNVDFSKRQILSKKSIINLMNEKNAKILLGTKYFK